jgi:Cation transport ATPase (P-type)
MEAALLILAQKGGAVPSEVIAALPRIAEIPFDAEHKFMSTFHRADGERVTGYVTPSLTFCRWWRIEPRRNPANGATCPVRREEAAFGLGQDISDAVTGVGRAVDDFSYDGGVLQLGQPACGIPAIMSTCAIGQNTVERPACAVVVVADLQVGGVGH